MLRRENYKGQKDAVTPVSGQAVSFSVSEGTVLGRPLGGFWEPSVSWILAGEYFLGVYNNTLNSAFMFYPPLRVYVTFRDNLFEQN